MADAGKCARDHFSDARNMVWGDMAAKIISREEFLTKHIEQRGLSDLIVAEGRQRLDALYEGADPERMGLKYADSDMHKAVEEIIADADPK